MDVFNQRLEQEFDASVIPTAPNVPFKGKLLMSYLPYQIGGVMVSMLALSAVDCGFKSQSCQIKDYKIGICCFSTKHARLKCGRLWVQAPVWSNQRL